MANEPGKGPGEYSRRGLSPIEVMNLFPTDDAARQWFEEVRWGGEPACIDCGSLNVQCGASHPSQTHRCRDCRKFFSVTKGTAMERTKLGLRVWAIAIYLMSTQLRGRASTKLRRDLGITQKAAWHLAHRLRKAWEDNNGLTLFDGPVEVDESCFGGGLANMSNARLKGSEGTRRGPVGCERAVIGAKGLETGRVVERVIERTNREALQALVDDHASPDVMLYADDTTACRGSGRTHRAVKQSAGEYVRHHREVVHPNGVESFWSMLKRAHKETFDRTSPKHLKRYVNAFSFCDGHNVRELDSTDQMRLLGKALGGKRLRFRDLTA